MPASQLVETSRKKTSQVKIRRFFRITFTVKVLLHYNLGAWNRLETRVWLPKFHSTGKLTKFVKLRRVEFSITWTSLKEQEFILLVIFFFLVAFLLGEREWRSGESAGLPPMWPEFKSRRRRNMWVEFVVGSHSGFPLSKIPNSSSTRNRIR